MLSLSLVLAAILVSFRHFSWGMELDLDDPDSLRLATALLADGILDYYSGKDPGGTVGMFTNPYYWWQAGAAWGSILDYGFYMENNTYEGHLIEAMLAQVGERIDYVPAEQATTEGNDDQAFWGMTAMAATERNLTNPPEGQPQWLALAQAVFNTMASRWDDSTCGGGLRWQIFKFNDGYDYKNSVSNGALFHIASRLARYTGNNTYVEWAEKTYDWMQDVGFIADINGWHFVYDGAPVEGDCRNTSRLQWTYNHGLILSGCAYLYNYTGSDIWHERTRNFLQSAVVFFDDDEILHEAACQGVGPDGVNTCNVDQRSFKAYFSRFLGLTAQLVPESRTQIMSWLRASALAAASSCSGGYDGHTCGMNWFIGHWDGVYGLGEQMAALEVFQNLRCLDRPAPYTAADGGSSIGNFAAGTTPVKYRAPPLNINRGDIGGAVIITTIIGITIAVCVVWLVI
ncbi:HCL495Cp [Eremothecium sinecaudum]|uniref:Mannan endo-1,6-alpha-mannosidase n=1 Tax=Eremothecium sinecaudum TaxID=45286 RepID=A0A109UW50_9SACH|nr:HCL495Cp [Eremothecium sinecaudum]AMD19656.1 HCL495Cp [Eremothecium sinecaudum]